MADPFKYDNVRMPWTAAANTVMTVAKGDSWDDYATPYFLPRSKLTTIIAGFYNTIDKGSFRKQSHFSTTRERKRVENSKTEANSHHY